MIAIIENQFFALLMQRASRVVQCFLKVEKRSKPMKEQC